MSKESLGDQAEFAAGLEILCGAPSGVIYSEAAKDKIKWRCLGGNMTNNMKHASWQRTNRLYVVSKSSHVSRNQQNYGGIS